MAIHISYQLSPPWLLFDYSFSVIFFYLLCRVGLRDLFAVCSSNWPKTTVFFRCFCDISVSPSCFFIHIYHKFKIYGNFGNCSMETGLIQVSRKVTCFSEMSVSVFDLCIYIYILENFIEFFFETLPYLLVTAPHISLL